MTTLRAAPALRRPAATAARIALAVAAGLAVGVATSLLQAHLNQPWLALVNSASPWLVFAFAAGAMLASVRGTVLPGVRGTVLPGVRGTVLPGVRGTVLPGVRVAALTGLLTCAGEVAGYYVTAALRGFPAGTAYLIFWSACALIGGPLFGAAGWAWRYGTGRSRGLGSACVPAAFLAEGLIGYGLRLHYTGSAVLFGVLGVASALALGLPGRRLPGMLAWLPLALAAGVAAEFAVGLIAGAQLA